MSSPGTDHVDFSAEQTESCGSCLHCRWICIVQSWCDAWLGRASRRIASVWTGPGCLPSKVSGSRCDSPLRCFRFGWARCARWTSSGAFCWNEWMVNYWLPFTSRREYFFKFRISHEFEKTHRRKLKDSPENCCGRWGYVRRIVTVKSLRSDDRRWARSFSLLPSLSYFNYSVRLALKIHSSTDRRRQTKKV